MSVMQMNPTVAPVASNAEHFDRSLLEANTAGKQGQSMTPQMRASLSSVEAYLDGLNDRSQRMVATEQVLGRALHHRYWVALDRRYREAERQLHTLTENELQVSFKPHEAFI